MFKISIPTPCHEDWNKMTPDETGRHCSSCAKSVVDFTNMSDEEVKHFFINKRQDERVCGRLKQTQLHRIQIELPQNILSIQMPLWKKFLAACLLVFSTTLFSCDTLISDKRQREEDQKSITIGVLAMPPTNTIPAPALPPPPSEINGAIFKPVQEIQGDIAIEVIEPATPIGIAQIEPVKDTAYENLIGKAFIINDSVTSAKTKDPQKADPKNCNSIKNYH